MPFPIVTPPGVLQRLLNTLFASKEVVNVPRYDYHKFILSDAPGDTSHITNDSNLVSSLNRLMKYVGYPKLEYDSMLQRAFYHHPTIHARTLDDIVAEASHALQFQMYSESSLRDKAAWEYNHYGDKKRYSVPGTVEWEAHTGIEPTLKDSVHKWYWEKK